MKRYVYLVLIAIFAISMMLFGLSCKEEAGTAGEEETVSSATEETVEESAEEETEEVVAEEEMLIIAISHHDTTNPYNSIIGNGVKQAGIDLGIRTEYVGQAVMDPVQQIANIDAALAKKPAGLSISAVDRDALVPRIKEIVDSGIPVIMHQGGDAFFQEAGALCYIGAPAIEEGRTVAKELVEVYGCKNIAYVNHVQGNVTVEDRGIGFTEYADEAGVQSTTILTDVQDAEKTAAALKAAFLKDPTIDGISGGWAGMTGILLPDILEELGLAGKVTVGIMDGTPEYYEFMKEGKVQFSTSLQQYLQGYLPIVFLYDYVKYGVSPRGIVLTGPKIIDINNVDDVIKYIDQGTQ